MDWNEPTSFAVVCKVSVKVNNSPETQYNVFSAEVKHIMLCMDLWRLREYPVDKLLLRAESAPVKASAGLTWPFADSRL
jgi:hypothetical protein